MEKKVQFGYNDTYNDNVFNTMSITSCKKYVHQFLEVLHERQKTVNVTIATFCKTSPVLCEIHFVNSNDSLYYLRKEYQYIQNFSFFNTV